MSKIDDMFAEYCPDGVEFRELGDICVITRGRVMSKEYLQENAGNYPVYSSQISNNGVFGRINTYDYDGTYITWTTDGANAGSVFYRNNEKFSITNVCGLLKNRAPDIINFKFIYYVLAAIIKAYVNDGMGNPKLMSNIMSTVKIPIPPLSIQQEIVKVLDAFTEELAVGLEAELEYRHKQYEYYRDKLLSFE
jgi:type I restriction enzyme S subunit